VTAPARKKDAAPLHVAGADDAPPVITDAAPARARRPRQVTRGLFITTAALVTAVLGWRYASGHHPGRTTGGHVFWFVVWDALLTGLILFVVTGYKHRGYRDRAGRRYDALRQGAHNRWGGGAGRPDHYAQPIPADEDRGWRPPPGARPAAGGGRRHRAPHVNPAGAKASAKASAAWRAVYAELTDVDGENGQEVLARILSAVAGLRLIGTGLEELRTHVTTDRGYDSRAVPALDQAARAVDEAAGEVDQAPRQIAAFYEHLIDAADDGKIAPHDGHEFEDR